MVKKMGKNRVTIIKVKAGKITLEQKINIYDEGDIKSREAIDEIAAAVVEKFGKAIGQEITVETDAVFIFTGMLPQTELVEMLEKDSAGYIKTNEEMETAVPGLFAVGDVRSKSFRQVVTAVSDGAIAAHRACELKLHSKN